MNNLRDKIAKELYESAHPRMYETYEHLKRDYAGAAEAVCRKADRYINIVKEDPEIATALKLLNSIPEGKYCYGSGHHPSDNMPECEFLFNRETCAVTKESTGIGIDTFSFWRIKHPDCPRPAIQPEGEEK